jgi:hypothetical protein
MNADDTKGIGTRLHELIEAHKMVEYAALKRIAVEQGKDVSEGEALHWKGEAMKELNEKFFKNPEIVSGNVKYGTKEHIDVDKAVIVLQRMMNDTSCLHEGCSVEVHAAHGTSHLEQALGKDAADKLLQEMYAAQRLGKNAEKTQRRFLTIVKCVAFVIVIALIIWASQR